MNLKRGLAARASGGVPREPQLAPDGAELVTRESDRGLGGYRHLATACKGE
jgi:hypothetical protein